MRLSDVHSVPKNCNLILGFRNYLHFPARPEGAFFLRISVQVCKNLTRGDDFGTMSDNVVNNFVIFLKDLQ